MIEQTLSGDFLEMAQTQQDAQAELLAKENVVGVALGHKLRGGVDTGEPALLVLVRQKVQEELLLKEDRVPKKLGERKTDVLEVGNIFASQITMERPSVSDMSTNGVLDSIAPAVPRAQRVGVSSSGVSAFQLQQRIRPVMGGFSVGHYAITAGTIGTCCYDMTPYPGIPQRFYILSNNHVLANSNMAQLGDPILQPGPFDGGLLPSDTIAELSRYVPIQFMAPPFIPLNYVDAAIAEVPFHLANRQIYWIGHVRDIEPAPAVGDVVQKTGRTTNYSTGRIIAVNATVDVNYGGGKVARFVQQILTTNMSAGGDSGSLVLTLDERAVGLLFAGSSVVTVVNSMVFVQSQLGIRVHEA